MEPSAYLEKLRAKPEPIRHRMAVWSAAGITLVIFVFWSISFADKLGGSLANPYVANTPIADNGAIEAVPTSEAVTVARSGLTVESTSRSPIGSLTAAVGNVWNDLLHIVWSPKKVIYTVEVRSGK